MGGRAASGAFRSDRGRVAFVGGASRDAGEGEGSLSSRFLLLRSFGPQGSSACDVHPACATSPCSPPASRTVPVTGAGWHPPSVAVAPPTRAPGGVPHGRLRPRALPGASGEASARGTGRAPRRRRGLGPRGLRTHVRPRSGVCDVVGPPHAPALGACAVFLHRHTHAGARRRPPPTATLPFPGARVPRPPGICPLGSAVTARPRPPRALGDRAPSAVPRRAPCRTPSKTRVSAAAGCRAPSPRSPVRLFPRLPPNPAFSHRPTRSPAVLGAGGVSLRDRPPDLSPLREVGAANSESEGRFTPRRPPAKRVRLSVPDGVLQSATRTARPRPWWPGPCRVLTSTARCCERRHGDEPRLRLGETS